MKSNSFAPVLALLVSIVAGSCHAQDGSSVAAPRLFQRGDELIRLYHSLPNSTDLDPTALWSSLPQANNSGFRESAMRIAAERDSFKKKDMIDTLVADFRRSQANDSAAAFVAVTGMFFVKPYDFQTKSFTVCWSTVCTYPSLEQRTGNYALTITLPSPGHFSFSPPEESARQIERSVAGNGGRLVRAVVIAAIDGAEPLKREEYRILAHVVQVKLLSGPAIGGEPRDYFASSPFATINVGSRKP
jgi:hypothetical protein